MSHHKRSGIDYFNLKELNKNVVRFTYNEARRCKGHIYDALIKELYEEGCIKAACYFHRLVDMEEVFYNNHFIRDRVHEHPSLLLSLFDNIKLAELSSYVANCNGLAVTFQLLYQCILLLEPFREKFDWVLSECFQIITQFCDKQNAKRDATASENEIVARIYHKYGSYLGSKDETMESVKYLEKAMQISRGQSWVADVKAPIHASNVLHVLIAKELCELLMKWGEIKASTDMHEALKLNCRAILAISEAHKESNTMLICRVYLRRADILLSLGENKAAFSILKKVEADLNGVAHCDAPFVTCGVYFSLGRCLRHLNQVKESHFKLRQTLAFSRLFGFKQLEALGLLQLGKIYRDHIFDIPKSKAAIEGAKNLFIELGDERSTKRTTYLLAKLQADEMYPYLLKVIRESPQRYCCLYALRQWKNQCRSFWPITPDIMADERNQEIYCLLDEGLEALTKNSESKTQLSVKSFDIQ